MKGQFSRSCSNRKANLIKPLKAETIMFSFDSYILATDVVFTNPISHPTRVSTGQQIVINFYFL